MDKSFIAPLSTAERLSLATHLCICKGCKVYAKQSKVIEESLQKMMRKKIEFDSTSLKKKIKESIDKEEIG